ncbi:regulator of chromosome condensation [Anaeramoeba flamelloides]|uniref:Regulator of chromosome condensation n=1 Tax=Anaeramoeba flamelloides TaxID=1746091 RepID=A0AAV7Y7T4_9EUKA|nr:regulator of chromosome condensation [Anaeramoeba flamelloides]
MIEPACNIYLSYIHDEYKKLLPSTNNTKNFWLPVKKYKSVRRIISDHVDNVIFLTTQNEFELVQKGKQPRKFQIENEEIKDIKCGLWTFLILTRSGKVYSLGSKNEYCELPFEDPENSTWEKLRYVKFFEDENLFVESIEMGTLNNYYICTGNKLYGNGYIGQGRLGIPNGSNVKTPRFLFDDVERVFCGKNAFGVIYDMNKELMACGLNSRGSLGLVLSEPHVPTKVKLPFTTDQIKDLQIGEEHSTLVTLDGVTYGAGSDNYNGVGKRCTSFVKVPLLNDVQVKSIHVGKHQTLVVTNENEIYGWGFGNYKNEKESTDLVTNSKLPTKFNLPNLTVSGSFQISCGFFATFIYNSNEQNNVQAEFKLLLKNQQFTDTEFGYGLKGHKSLIETRTGLKIEQIQKVFQENNYTKNEINMFLKWLYSDEIPYQRNDKQSFENILKSLQLQYDPKETIIEYLKKLYNDEDSKDFLLLVKSDDYGNEDEDDDDDDEEENFEEIPVHKFILLARSGLFREMFNNINENEKNINQIKDYSGKSIESLEILIKYFYFDSIELTADDDPQLIIEELEDAQEYYQLHEACSLNIFLRSLKIQYNIN